MNAYDFDLFVIGGGSGGVRASRIAAGYGAKVAVAEEYRLGGTCVIRGCVPKKLLMYASQFGMALEDSKGFGWQVPEASHEWQSLARAKDSEVGRLEQVYEGLLGSAGVKVIKGKATIAGTHEVCVNGVTFTADHILIATGATPEVPQIPGAELMVTSNEVLALERPPERIAIVGGGYIACEFAGIFKGLGSSVWMVHRGSRLLRGFDEQVREHIGNELAANEIQMRLGTTVAAVERKRNAYQLYLGSGEILDVDLVMAATGRRPNTDGLGLERVGVHVDARGAIPVDSYSRTSCNHVYAVGDVTDRLNLTPVAIHEGHAFADTVFGNRPRRTDHEGVPFAVFSQPQVAAVGLTEEEACARHGAVRVYSSAFRPMRAALSGRKERVLVKLIADAATDRILGAHIVAADAAEIIQGIAIALKAGATKTDFDATIGVHPSVAEEFVTLKNARYSTRLQS
ncbi:glutathione-disulfide reductase [Paraburkholderia sp. UYCP14C]|uniref:glutathione-disulfide reductase n=1 Tax=Paraburkholderia sp. UYCP14C TaxID=2511130 RepID=UPI00101ED53D|nr:glutathione-disulfide reductase [Paraburkholderia sp. UYCP14C]RZF25799.1 glutathione-disulfide reductase [Paraburkholderia sp. UYCP14C]